MTRRSFFQTSLIRLTYILFDVGAITLAFYLACLLRPQTVPFQVNLQEFLFGSQNTYRLILGLWLLLILFFNQTHNLYQTRRAMLETVEIWEIIKSVMSATLVFIVLTYLVKAQDFPRSVVFISNILLIVFLSLWRVSS